jgi:hypothetical protein
MRKIQLLMLAAGLIFSAITLPANVGSVGPSIKSWRELLADMGGTPLQNIVFYAAVSLMLAAAVGPGAYRYARQHLAQPQALSLAPTPVATPFRVDDVDATVTFKDGRLELGLGNAGSTLPDVTLNFLVPQELGGIHRLDHQGNRLNSGTRMNTAEPLVDTCGRELFSHLLTPCFVNGRSAS